MHKGDQVHVRANRNLTAMKDVCQRSERNIDSKDNSAGHTCINCYSPLSTTTKLHSDSQNTSNEMCTLYKHIIRNTISRVHAYPGIPAFRFPFTHLYIHVLSTPPLKTVTLWDIHVYVSLCTHLAYKQPPLTHSSVISVWYKPCNYFCACV